MGELENDGTVSQETCEKLHKMFADETDNPARMLRVWFLDEMSDSLRKAIENNPLPKGFKPDKKAAVREHLEMCWKDLDRLSRKLRQREKTRARDRTPASQHPQWLGAQTHTNATRPASRATCDGAIDQLERLQRLG